MSLTTVSNNTTPIRQRNKAAPYLPSYLEEGQACVVCGDQATGLHYRAITCEGCKGFWRRSEQRHLVYACKNNEQCIITKHNRNVCQRCRYVKCVAAGMCSDLVLDESERTQKRELIRENRERRQLEIFVQKIRGEQDPTRSKELREAIRSITQSYCNHIDRHPTDVVMEDELCVENDEERNAKRFETILRPVVKKISAFASALPVYQQIPYETRCDLQKASLLEVQLLRFIMFYDSEEDCFRPVDQTFLRKSDFVHCLHGEEMRPFIDELFQIASAFDELQIDLRLMAVISAMFFFNPDNGIENFSSLTETQSVLSECLRLLSDESCDSPDIRRWPRLLTRIGQLKNLSMRMTRYFNPAHVDFFQCLLTV